MEKRNHHFLLLQINDALFPIGGYSHSYGLETYIQYGLVKDAATADRFIRNRLRYSIFYTDLLAVRLAYEAAVGEQMGKLDRLEKEMEASRIPEEVREASKKLGRRFVKTINGMETLSQLPRWKDYLEKRAGKTTCHPCAYGTLCAAAGMEKQEVLAGFLYAQTSAMVTNCVKTIPLSQSEGQKLLFRLHPLLEEMTERVNNVPEEMLCASTPGFDLRCIQHETLYSRLYMS